MLRSRRFVQSLKQFQPQRGYGSGGYRFHAQSNLKLHLVAASLSATLSTVAYKAHCDEAIPVYVPPPPPIAQAPILATSTLVAEFEEEDVEDKSYWGYLVRQAKHAMHNISHGARYLERILTYLVVGAPLAGLVPANYVLGSTFPELENMTWGYLVWAIQRLGPCFIKMAQWASTRPDLFPPKLIEKIEKFQDDVQISYPMSVIENTLRKAFGEDWKKKIVLEKKPLGTGSVAQVFQGLLKTAETSSEGIQVAIKMIHPHVEELVRTDMELLTMLANWVDKMPSMEIFALGDTVKDFAHCMNQQLDLRLEASHLVKFAKKFANEKWALFPKPVEGFVTRNVMVETLMEGTPINYFMNLPSEVGSATHKLKMKLSDLGTRLILKMVFFDNYIHGDLHPGNVLVQVDPNGDARLVILDCGIVYASKSDAEHQRLVDICFAFMQHDGRRAGQLMVDTANSKRPDTVKNSEAFCESIQRLIDETEERNYFEHLTEYVSEICELARVHVVRLDPGYFKIVMALKVAEGIALALDRELDLISKCVPIVLKTRAMRQMGLAHFPLPENDDEFMQTKTTAKKTN